MKGMPISNTSCIKSSPLCPATQSLRFLIVCAFSIKLSAAHQGGHSGECEAGGALVVHTTRPSYMGGTRGDVKGGPWWCA